MEGLRRFSNKAFDFLDSQTKCMKMWSKFYQIAPKILVKKETKHPQVSGKLRIVTKLFSTD